MPDKNTAQPVLLWTNNHGYLQAWKSRPIKRDYVHILKTYLQITYKITTLTGAACGTC